MKPSQITSANVNKVVRRTHMYLALFLVPWVMLYAISTIAMNHRSHLQALYATPRSSWVTEREVEVEREFSSGEDSSQLAREILAELNMNGRHSVRGRLENGALTIIRQESFAPRRIRYVPAEGTLTIERRESRAHEWLNALHSRRGYAHGYPIESAWAVSVDVVIAATLFWAGSGLWLWWCIPKSRWMGGMCLVSGAALFCAFLFVS